MPHIAVSCNNGGYRNMEYGYWRDWLSCLGFIVFCEFTRYPRFPRMSQSNPEGHSPKYWRRHSEARSAIKPASLMDHPGSPASPHLPLSKKLLGGGLITLVSLAFGGAMSATFSHYPFPADALYIVGCLLIAAALIISPELTPHRKQAWWTLLLLLVVLVCLNHFLNRVWPFSLKSQLKITCHMNGSYGPTARETNVYMTIANLPTDAVEHIDLTIRRDSRRSIRSISEFIYNDCAQEPINTFPEVRNVISGEDGDHLAIGDEQQAEDYIKRFGSPRWRVQCARLGGQSAREFSLDVAGDAETETLAISGSYDLPPSAGNKHVPVNEACKITR